MATVQLSTASATPSDYGFPVPNPEPALPADFDTFAPPLLGSSDSDAPAVAESTKTAAPDDSLVLTGSGFSNGQTNFRLYGQTSDTDAVTVDQTPNLINPVAASVTLPKSLLAWSMYLAWPQTSGLYGEPVAVNRTDAWWVGSDQATATDKISVYGRNLAHANGTTDAWVYVKPVDSPTGDWATVKSVNPYQVSFTLPAGTKPGTYELWLHNGHGGHFGWSAPLTLTVLPQSPWAGQSAHVFNVKTYGAKGDGITDDRTAIQATIDAAAASGPSTVYFPAGTYMVGGELDPADKVSWLGDGRDKTFIKANASFPTSSSYAFVFSDSSNVNDVEFKNLTLDGNGNLGDKQLLLFRHHDNVKLTNLRLIFRSG